MVESFRESLREWLELIPLAWTNFYPVNRAYDALEPKFPALRVVPFVERVRAAASTACAN